MFHPTFEVPLRDLCLSMYLHHKRSPGWQRGLIFSHLSTFMGR